MSLIAPFDPWDSKLCTCPRKLTFNPYTGCDHACLYCYASSYIPRFFDCRPKKDLIPRLTRESAKLKGEMISISNSSDPYPDLEKKTGLTRKCLEILTQRNCKIQIITKSLLITRDIDLLRKVPSMVSLTVTTNDDNIAKLMEPHAPPPSERLKAVETLIVNGIPTCVRIDPIVPFVNDNLEGLIETLACIDVKHVTVSTYKVKMDNWKRLSMAMPETAEKLKPLYFERGEKVGRCIYMPKDVRFKLVNTVREICRRRGVKFGTCREGLNYLNTAVCDGSGLLAKAC